MAIAEENQIVQVVLPRERVKDIDARARAQQRTRSAFVRILILECLQTTRPPRTAAGESAGDKAGDGVVL
jgi:hypothetical protein